MKFTTVRDLRKFLAPFNDECPVQAEHGSELEIKFMYDDEEAMLVIKEVS